jgi:hypothetical protein
MTDTILVTGNSWAERKLQVNHIGYCMDSFSTDTCGDCFTVRDCLVMYGKDLVKGGVPVGVAVNFIMLVADATGARIRGGKS